MAATGIWCPQWQRLLVSSAQWATGKRGCTYCMANADGLHPASLLLIVCRPLSCSDSPNTRAGTQPGSSFACPAVGAHSTSAVGRQLGKLVFCPAPLFPVGSLALCLWAIGWCWQKEAILPPFCVFLGCFSSAVWLPFHKWAPEPPRALLTHRSLSSCVCGEMKPGTPPLPSRRCLPLPCRMRRFLKA